ncbi:MAG TPA: hypothetical protein VN950_13600 [Terriglobales bacterium]|nr:hypothetical protein [Terriglobales bacterium]
MLRRPTTPQSAPGGFLELAELIDLHLAFGEHGFDFQLASHGSDHGLQGADLHELHTPEVPFSVDYGSDDYLCGLHAIDDPIAVGDQLARVLVVEFRHLASCTGEFLKRTREFDDSSHH